MTTAVNLYSYDFAQKKTYLFAALFILGNIIVPQLCHLIPGGGLMFLPIYFFTLIGAYKYGWKVGLLTAVLSPLVNSALFGMPAAPALVPILFKGVVLALSAGWIASRSNKVSILLLAAVVLLYQVTGSLFESALEGSLAAGFSDFTHGIPGMLIQVFGGYLFIRYLLKK
ncbi:MAG: ECF transporter S component [Bacteroidales bacterium]|nr:ECF transporter S component [Bacteroidales bacterium]